MAEKHGKGGSITFTGITVGVKDWSLNMAVDIHDITDFGDSGLEKNIAGITRWTATASANFDATNTADVGDSATLTLAVDGSDNWDGAAILASYDVSVPVNDVATIAYNFVGNGTLTPPS